MLLLGHFFHRVIHGLRTGEVCALTWNDIDLIDGIIKVNHNVYDKKKDEKPQKNNAADNRHKNGDDPRSAVLPVFLFLWVLVSFCHYCILPFCRVILFFKDCKVSDMKNILEPIQKILACFFFCFKRIE